MMKKVGVTGGIGAGKTTVCKIFSALGVPVYNADLRAKNIMNSSATVQSAIIEVFGISSYQEGMLNRDHIAKMVFNNQDQLTLLNSIVHPQVALDYSTWLSKHGIYAYTIKEAALLIDSGAYHELDSVLHVTAPLELKIKRVQIRDAFRTSEEILNIISKQLSDEERNAKSNVIITNDEAELLIPQVVKIHNDMCR